MSFRDEYNVGYIPGNMLSEIDEFAKFYSEHYGQWSNESGLQGNITLSAKRLTNWLDENSLIFYARLNSDNSLIGYAIAEQKTIGKDDKMIIWVTQFVVHKEYRNQKVGFDLLSFVWGLSHAYAWGLVTANPYAVRALEKATRRRCTPKIIKKNLNDLLLFGENYVNYVNNNTETIVSDTESIINTNFLVDHSDVPEKIKNVTQDTPWSLGDLPEGYEWLAFVFNEQPQFDYTDSELQHLLTTSDEITKQAYGKMLMEKHVWTKHTDDEVNYIIKKCGLQENSSFILDVGCGLGRHTIELNKRGFNAIGIDYSRTLVEKAKGIAVSNNLKKDIIQLKDFSVYDSSLSEGKYDCVICIYDVIGSYIDEDKNLNILKNIYTVLKNGGRAVISVMNMQLTSDAAQNKFVLKESSRPLLELAPSETMQNTGNIFNPKYFLVDTQENIVYRKELFSYPGNRSIVSVVRDRRYYLDSISQMCIQTGFNILEYSFVKANGWKESYSYNDKNAKEILLLLQK